MAWCPTWCGVVRFLLQVLHEIAFAKHAKLFALMGLKVEVWSVRIGSVLRLEFGSFLCFLESPGKAFQSPKPRFGAARPPPRPPVSRRPPRRRRWHGSEPHQPIAPPFMPVPSMGNVTPCHSHLITCIILYLFSEPVRKRGNCLELGECVDMYRM